MQPPGINHNSTWKHILSQFRALLPGMTRTSPRLVFELAVSPLHASLPQPRYCAAWNISIKCSHLNAGHDCCSHWLVRLRQTGPLSVVPHLFSHPTARVSQKGRVLGEFCCQTLWSISRPLFTLDRYETCFPKGDTKLLPKCHSAETVLGHLSAVGKSHREGGENLKWPFPTYPVEGRVSFQSPLTCCFQSSFLCCGLVNKLAICYLLLRCHRTCVLKHCKVNPFVISH